MRRNALIYAAAEAALELFRAGSHVTLVHRHPQLKPSIKYWVRPDIENRIKEGSVRGLLNTKIVEIQPTQVIVERDGSKEEIPADAVFLLTGYHPDCDLYRRAGIRLHRETMAPEFNPETFETNVSGMFLAGGAICGIAVAAIAGWGSRSGKSAEWLSDALGVHEALGGKGSVLEIGSSPEGLAVKVDGAKFADAWRAQYAPSMNRVRSGELPWTRGRPLPWTTTTVTRASPSTPTA